MKKNKLCFVIMGFGKKTDLETGRILDLDKTYKNIIEPAVENSGYECIRADQIQGSNIIDKSMYALLVHADLVIADISTYNPNAIYELGIRHAVRPFSTIILKEKEGKIPFDLDHNRIFFYSHSGTDIGFDEVIRCKTALTNLIEKVTNARENDSPLYEYINITPPKMDDEEIKIMIDDLAEKGENLFAITKIAEEARDSEPSDFKKSYKYWKKAHAINPNNPYYIQQYALTRYKSKDPSLEVAITDALKIMSLLDPDNTTDVETLGITGAIYKTLYTENRYIR